MTTLVSISSLVARGHVGNSAAAFALNRIGLEVWPVVTVALARHPGHGSVHCAVTSPSELAHLLQDVARDPLLPTVAAIHCGYLADEGQAEPVAALVAAVKRANADAVFCCDPIIGDDGALYVGEDIAAAIRDQLLPLADIATPNLFELGWLMGEQPLTTAETVACAKRLGPATVMVSSAPAMLRGTSAALLVGAQETLLAETPLFDKIPHGAGDLASALFLGHLLRGAPAHGALERSLASVFEILQRTVREGADELALIACQEALVRPAGPVHIRRLGGN